MDFLLEDEASFDAAAEFAYTAYLSEILSRPHLQNNVEIADQILGSNLDKVTSAYNSDSFDNDIYEAVVSCYRQLGIQMLEKIDVIMLSGDEYQNLINTSVQTLKRMLRTK